MLDTATSLQWQYSTRWKKPWGLNFPRCPWYWCGEYTVSWKCSQETRQIGREAGYCGSDHMSGDQSPKSVQPDGRGTYTAKRNQDEAESVGVCHWALLEPRDADHKLLNHIHPQRKSLVGQWHCSQRTGGRAEHTTEPLPTICTQSLAPHSNYTDPTCTFPLLMWTVLWVKTGDHSTTT